MFNSLVTRLAEQAIRQPEKVAINYRNRCTTYGELWRNIESVTRYLLNKGLKKGQRVALLRENSPEYVESYYGILRAGGIVVSLNTAVKARDIINWVRHCKADWLFVSGAYIELNNITNELADGLKYVIIGDSDIDTKSGLSLDYFDELNEDKLCVSRQDLPKIAGEDMAAIIYTSGTTGHPKGVTLTHNNLVSNMESILAYLPITNEDKFLCVLPFYYSYGNSVLHTNLIAGSEIVIENSFLFPHAILKLMENEKITAFSGVPSTFALLLSRTKLEDYDLSSIQYITQAGGAMSPAHIERFRKHLPHCKFYVMYGQTEATARLTYLPPEMLDLKTGSVGMPIPGVTIEIRDKYNVPVQQGETGEIYASGPNIMQGYWEDVDLTNNVLLNGWLKTGDLAYQDKDDYIYIVGRQSEMIKSGAHRISPLDVEEVLLRCPEVSEAAVVGISDEILGQVIKACIVLKKDSSLTMRDLQLHCKKNLALYKIPKFIEFIDEIPKTASGKIKRFELQK